MQFRKGDKVRFLNEKGEGTVTRILGGGQVMVEVEDGFEFPFPVAQLVPAIPVEGSMRPEPAKKPEEKKENPSTPAPVSARQPDGIYLALIPLNQHIPAAGQLQLTLFNHSEYDIYYTLSLKESGSHTCIQAGALGPRRQAEIETLSAQEADNWATLQVDVLFFSEEPFEHRPPVSELIRFRGVKLFKDSSYTELLLTGSKACVFEVALLETLPAAPGQVLSADDLRRMLKEKERQESPRGAVSRPHLKNQLLEKEVDLHIEELLDNWNGMTNAQLLDIQLRRVQEEIDAAMALHLRKVVFIHGVGNGRLKQEVRRLLSTYKGLRFYDASYAKYGFGATEVELQ